MSMSACMRMWVSAVSLCVCKYNKIMQIQAEAFICNFSACSTIFLSLTHMMSASLSIPHTPSVPWQFPAMRALSISSADAFILVYDVTDATTFEEVRAIRDQIHETKATTAVPIVVVGNKVDLLAEDGELREVSKGPETPSYVYIKVMNSIS